MLAELAQNATATVRVDAAASLKILVENFVTFTFASRAESWVHIITIGEWASLRGCGRVRDAKVEPIRKRLIPRNDLRYQLR
jgi:hypothetical protein